MGIHSISENKKQLSVNDKKGHHRFCQKINAIKLKTNMII